MQTSPTFQLSDYQRAILNEMETSCWVLLNEQKSDSKVELKTAPPVASDNPISVSMPSSPVSKDSALAKLAALKQVTQELTSAKSTDKVILAITNELPNFSKDILLALELEAREQIPVTTEQVSDYVDYPLAWKQAESISLIENLLSTPALSKINNANSKKQLWHVLQVLIKNKK
ncbi:hypothetical protein [Paraglaciecola sp. L3A3]|uniref:hypothetical protein n=1 Tax=Paraglaciecola sp. L3A3 TaxID=2686358 RepID=UPI00131EB420|nr:hypothetical protein [Paraglaciecola sp. L3A3]